MKFLRVIRFDRSDDHVFARAAEPDEWAVSGAFSFIALRPSDIVGKTRQAFVNGFLGLPSFGRSTFAVIAEMGEAERGLVEGWLADHALAEHGAPDRATALAAARDEIAFVADLCEEKPVNTVLAVHRHLDGEGAIREAFREIAPPGEPRHARIWDIADDDT